MSRLTSSLIPFLIACIPFADAGGAPQATYDATVYGAQADGVTDDTAAVQKALDAAGQVGGMVALRPGIYRIEGSLNIPTGVCLQGAWAMPHHGVWDKGTTLYATRGRGSEDGPALIEMNASTAVRGLTIYYPDQDPESIVPYPWAIHGQGMHCTIENVTLVNPYNGISIGPEWNELHLIRNVYGCPLRRGLLVDMCTDIGRVENVHWNIHYWHRAKHPNGPKGEGPDQNYRRFVQENLQAFIFGRTDWESVKDTFTYGARIGYRFIDNGHGAMNGSLLGVGADGCLQGVWVDKIQPMGLLITNGQFAPFRNPEMGDQKSDPRVAAIVTAEGASGNVTLVNCSFWGGNPIAHLRGSHNLHAKFDNCHVRDWAVYDPGAPAIDVDGPTLTVRSCTFATGGSEIRIGEKTRAAVLTENVCSSDFDVERPEELDLIMQRNIVLPSE
jgi:hypothetical protein